MPLDDANHTVFPFNTPKPSRRRGWESEGPMSRRSRAHDTPATTQQQITLLIRFLGGALVCFLVLEPSSERFYPWGALPLKGAWRGPGYTRFLGSGPGNDLPTTRFTDEYCFRYFLRLSS